MMRVARAMEFQRKEERYAEMARDMVAASLLRLEQASRPMGREGFYFDRYLFMTKPTILRRLARLLSEMVAFDVERVAGTEPGSIVVASALSLETGIPLVVLHQGGGETGFGIGGELYAGERVLVVEDVVMSGRHACLAASRLAKVGASVVGVLAVVDREEGGAGLLNASGFPLSCLYELESLPMWDGEPNPRILRAKD